MTYEALLNYDNEVVIKGSRCITTPNELYQALVLKDTSEILIHKDFADAYFTPSGLSDLIANAGTVNPFCTIKVDSEVRAFEVEAVRELSRYNSIEDVMFQLQAHPAEMMALIKMLCRSYTDTYSETLVANNKVSSLQLQVTELQQRLKEKNDDYQTLLSAKQLVESKLGMLVGRINYSYERDIDPSQFVQIDGKSKYTKILYIKERTRVRYVDTLIYYLAEILRILYSVPARVLVIAPYYAYDGAQLYPHMEPSFDLSYTKLYKSDIYMPGFQPGVVEDILRNPSNVEYLIVLDRGGMGFPHILGDGVEYVYTMSDPKDNYDNIQPSRIISYFHDTLYIPFIEDWDKLSVEVRMQRYSSMKIMKFLLELLEQR